MSREHEFRLSEIARTRYGVVTAEDLVTVTGRPHEPTRRLASGAWREIFPGAFVPTSTPLSGDVLSAAACLAEPRAVLSHYDAARRAGLWVPETSRTWISVPFGHRLRELEGARLVRTRVAPEHQVSDHVLRWTTPARTVVDLAMVLTEPQLEAVLLSGVRAGLVVPAQVEAQLARFRGRKGVALLRRVLNRWAPERESLLEDGLADDVLSVVGEGVVRQHRVLDAAGRVIARLDVAVPALQLGFEADGLAYHSTDAQLASDQRRDRKLLGMGWLVVRFRQDVLADHHQTRQEIARVVARRRRDLLSA